MSSRFVNSISQLPSASLPAQAVHSLEALSDAGIELNPDIQRLVEALAGNAPFLAQLIAHSPQLFASLCDIGPEDTAKQVLQTLKEQSANASTQPELMQLLRRARGHMALLTAAADVSGTWNGIEVTEQLSRFADIAITIAADFLLREAHHKKLITLPNPNAPREGSGLIILAMGKLGGGELNYSSDIDLIILFEEDKLPYHGRQSLQHFFNHFAQSFTAMLQERTKDGYVFRTDLRLRPDPRSTPLAVKLRSAINYYENLGQNWERAAMIKARPTYADDESEAVFAQAMQAFIWRRHLDFAAIADIDSIKRQINAKIGEELQVRGHNVKLGRGGIREIEFFLQTRQLVWGGRDATLRTISSEQTLHQLLAAGHIKQQAFNQLRDAYWFLRRVEHHIQMTRDQQSHTIPESGEELQQLACFLGYDAPADFEQDVLMHCRHVHRIYADSMDQSPPLSHDGNLVFTGVEADPDTLRTLLRLGFTNPQRVSDSIQDWHRGARRATRSLKSRQMLTELTPALLSAFAATANPNDAFLRFDELISKVPVGVQIFSLLSARAEVMSLLAMILGSAPALGETLARYPALIDILLERNAPLADAPTLRTELGAQLADAEHEEEALRRLRQFCQEKQLHVGVKMLSGDIAPAGCGRFLSDVAEALIGPTYELAIAPFTEKYGHIKGGNFAILALGKLGTCELTFGSDLDLILLYDAPDGAISDGPRAIDARTYYQRLASRLCHAFTLRTPEGQLYELDIRLRPGGASGALATHITRLIKYFDRDGWDVEALGLTRARIVFTTDDGFAKRIEDAVAQIINKGFARAPLAKSIHSLRERITGRHPTQDPWSIKFQRGGIMDISLIAQFLRLSHPEAFGELNAPPNDDIFTAANAAALIDPRQRDTLNHAYRLQRDLQHVLRLSSSAQTITRESSVSLQKSVARLMGHESCDTLECEINMAQHASLKLFNQLIAP